MEKNKLNNITSTGFKTPEQYFESFDDKLFERLAEKKTIAGIETSGFTVPNDYFKTVEDNVFSKLNNEEKPVIRLKSKSKFYYVAGIAASFALLFSIVFNNKDVTFDAVDTLALESYLYQEDYTSDELAVLFTENDISVNDFIDVQISEETINQYIESIDSEDFILD